MTMFLTIVRLYLAVSALTSISYVAQADEIIAKDAQSIAAEKSFPFEGTWTRCMDADGKTIDVHESDDDDSQVLTMEGGQWSTRIKVQCKNPGLATGTYSIYASTPEWTLDMSKTHEQGGCRT